MTLIVTIIILSRRTDGQKRVRWPRQVLPLVSQFEYTPQCVDLPVCIALAARQTDRQTDTRPMQYTLTAMNAAGVLIQ